MKVAVLTQGENVPSTRFRIGQYIQKFNANNISVTFYHAKISAYPPANKWQRIKWLFSELYHRLSQIRTINKSDADCVILQRELISTLPTLERFIRKPIVFDVDDAIFLFKQGLAARTIAKSAAHIVCGNTYLAEYFNQFNKNISIIATPVDTKRFVPKQGGNNEKLLGWSGSSSGFKYLYEIEAELVKALVAFPDWKVFIIADKKPEFKQIPADRLIFQQWSPDVEVAAIQRMTIGLMPLHDDPWSKGKCSYKMLLYMACAVPCVVSNVGMNAEVLRHAMVGVGIDKQEAWSEALISLMGNPTHRDRFGAAGRVLTELEYSLEATAVNWLNVLRAID